VADAGYSGRGYIACTRMRTGSLREVTFQPAEFPEIKATPEISATGARFTRTTGGQQAGDLGRGSVYVLIGYGLPERHNTAVDHQRLLNRKRPDRGIMLSFQPVRNSHLLARIRLVSRRSRDPDHHRLRQAEHGVLA
jgi:hypothetical protein